MGSNCVTVANIGRHCMIVRDGAVTIQPALSGVEICYLQSLNCESMTISQVSGLLSLSYAYAWYISYRLEARGLVRLTHPSGNGVVITAIATYVESHE